MAANTEKSKLCLGLITRNRINVISMTDSVTKGNEKEEKLAQSVPQ